jgi:phosphate transport system protein
VVIQLGERIPVPMREFGQMAEKSASMLHRALGAFVNEDAALAREIVGEDDAVDELYNKAYHAIVASMIANPEIIDQANLLMWVAHNLERSADRSDQHLRAHGVHCHRRALRTRYRRFGRINFNTCFAG